MLGIRAEVAVEPTDQPRDAAADRDVDIRMDAVTANVHATLEPGGWFLISDLPFPETSDGPRTVPGRIMTGIQFWEAQIDDQLQPRRVYEELLPRHGFRDVDGFELTPVHAVTYGRA